MPTLLELRSLSRYFTRRSGVLARPCTVKAVQEVSLTLNAGETLGLVGESGCGKSTLARMAVRLLPPSKGDVLLNGQSIFTGPRDFLASLPRRLQMVFQDPYSSLNPRLSIGSSVGEAFSCAGMTPPQRKERVAELLKLVGLDPAHAASYPHEFSGGQRQRMALARAIAPEPDVVVCDEPVSSLDASVQAQVLNLLKDMQDKLKLAYIFISHDLAVVSHMSDRVAVMYLGQVVELAPAAELFSTPRHPYTQTLLELAAHKSTAPDQADEPPSPLNPPQGCPFHPRCHKADETCRSAVPELTPCGPEHQVRCLHS